MARLHGGVQGVQIHHERRVTECPYLGCVMQEILPWGQGGELGEDV